MPYIIPNTTAIPQTVSAAQIVVNGTTCSWPADKIVEGVKVIHHIECSIGTENTGAVPAELKFTLQRDIGSGWENVAGEVACYTVAAGDDARRKVNFKIPYYTGISGFVPRYRLLAECPAGDVTLHRAEGRDSVPTVTGKQEHEFEGEETVPVVVNIFNVNSSKSTPLPANPKPGITNKYVVIIPNSNTHVFFWQESGDESVFKSIVSTVSINEFGTDLVNGPVQTWSDPSMMGGHLFEDSAFQYAGNGCISCTFGTFNTPLGWIVNEAGRELQQITIQSGFIPSGYDYAMYCQRAAMEHVPALNINLMLEQDSNDDVHVCSFLSTGSAFTNLAVGDKLWDSFTEGVRPIPGPSNVGGRIYFAACGQSGRGVYAALLGNAQNRLALITVLAGALPTKISDYTFAALGTLSYPICVAGCAENERICLFWADGVGNVLASLFDCSGATPAQIGSNYTLITGQGAWIKFVASCCWLPESNQIVLLWPGTSGSDTWILDASATGLSVFDRYTSDSNWINGYCHVGSTQLGITKTVVRTAPPFGGASFAVGCDSDYGVPEEVTSGQVVNVNLAENGFKYIKITVPASVQNVQMTMTDFSGTYPGDILLRRLYPPRWNDYDACSWDESPPPFDISVSNSGATEDRIYYGRVDAWEAMTAKISIVLS